MKLKKKYSTPNIIFIDLDRSISLQMVTHYTPPDPNDPWGNSGSSGVSTDDSKTINSFDDNPFKK